MDYFKEIKILSENSSNYPVRKSRSLEYLPIVFVIIIIIVIFLFFNNKILYVDGEKDELIDIVKYVEECSKDVTYDKNSYIEVNWKPKIDRKSVV